MTGLNVSIVPLQERHLEATLFWLGNAELRDQIDMLQPPERSLHLKVWSTRLKDSTRADFAIYNDDKHVGNCGLCAIDKARRKGELWIYLGEGNAKGIGTNAVKLLIEHGFERLGLNRIYLRVLGSNLRARKFYERLGFRHEGTLRADSIVGDRFVNSELLGLLREDSNSWRQ